MHLAGYTPINHVRMALWKACLSPASVGVQENIIKGKDQSVRARQVTVKTWSRYRTAKVSEQAQQFS